MEIEKLRYKQRYLIHKWTQDYNSTEQNITKETHPEESNESNLSISSDKQSTDFETIETEMEE